MINEYQYGIVEDNSNHFSFTAKDERGNILIKVEINDVKGLEEAVSREEIWKLFEEFRTRIDKANEKYELPKTMYDLNVSDECWNDILTKVCEELDK